MKKFKFRLETLKRARKISQDLAQREYAEAQKKVRDQMALIQGMYTQIDKSREKSELIQLEGGQCRDELVVIEEFINVQKIKILNARSVARDLMQIAEECLDALTIKTQEYKIIEKLKEKQTEEYRKEKNKKQAKEIDDLVITRYLYKDKVI
jgi:flagellar FliJ protein